MVDRLGRARVARNLHNVRVGAVSREVLLAARVAVVVGSVRAEEVVVLVGAAPRAPDLGVADLGGMRSAALGALGPRLGAVLDVVRAGAAIARDGLGLAGRAVLDVVWAGAVVARNRCLCGLGGERASREGLGLANVLGAYTVRMAELVAVLALHLGAVVLVVGRGLAGSALIYGLSRH